MKKSLLLIIASVLLFTSCTAETVPNNINAFGAHPKTPDKTVVFAASDIIDEAEVIKYYNDLVNKEIDVAVCLHEETLDKERVGEMLLIKDGVLFFNDDAINGFIDELKEKYETYGTNRSFTTSTGYVTTLERGNYGWAIDREETAEAIKEALLSEGNTGIEAAYSVYGRRDPFNEISDTYMEVSINDQHVWLYVNGALVVDTPCCTGNIKTGSLTRRGMFAITYKQTNCVLRGSDYEEPVSYWVPFDGNIGFHDATWRTPEEFGGDVYLENGSHGCVNLPLEAAGVIFENVQMDTPIIVY